MFHLPLFVVLARVTFLHDWFVASVLAEGQDSQPGSAS